MLFRSWLFDMTNYLTATGVDDQVVGIRIAASYLEKEAAAAWREKAMLANPPHGCPFSHWDAFRAWLMDTNLPPEIRKRARKTFQRCRQGASETTLAYATRFRSLRALVHPEPTDEDSLNYFVDGLPPRLRQEVTRDAPATYEEAMASALRLAEVYGTDQRDGHRGGMGRTGGRSGQSRYSGYSGREVTPMELGVMQHAPRGRGRGRSRGRGGRGGGRGGNNGGNNGGTSRRRGGLPREADGLDPQELRRHLDNGLCFRCHQPGHQTRDCRGPGA